MRFSQCPSDSCIFVRQQGNSIIYITLYVDDMLMKDLGNARYVLGIAVSYEREARKLKINQE
uniref:AlNc14C421G11522 protein n=1 Tax=Albugo laibachii Nc14 TaxID=890382 RepID=F0WZB9_9STRA|nr:AlNc14C421G11522 [Albugo laibachii Nc14]|eukprot:CCA26837.1 AlNc14C421G11522 [Albugo laibachii Nc14]